MDREILGFVIPLAWFIAYPALIFALILGPVLASMHTLQRQIGTYTLVAIGLVAVAASFGVLIPMERLPLNARASMCWIAASLTYSLLVSCAWLAGTVTPSADHSTSFCWRHRRSLVCGGHSGICSQVKSALWTRWPAEYVLGSWLPYRLAALFSSRRSSLGRDSHKRTCCSQAGR